MPKQVTLADVAAQAGVSVALVSIVMRDAPGAAPATRERVLAAAQEIGYEPDRRARLLRSGRTRLLGVVFGVEHAFHGDLLAGLYGAAATHGYELTLSAVTGRRDEATAVRSLLGDRCEALILLGPESGVSELRTLAARMPVVVVARGVRGVDVDTVRTADAEGLEQAVDHLVSLGHRRIAHIDGGHAAGAADRRRGYRAAMRRHGLTEQLVEGGPTEDDGARAAHLLLDTPSRPGSLPGASLFFTPTSARVERTGSAGGAAGVGGAPGVGSSGGLGLPSAITVFNDRCATGVLDALRAAGVSVPGDISVTGFDDSRLARLTHVSLTTIAQDADALAELAVTHAAARITGAPLTPREVVVPPTLVVRSTTAPPRET